MITIADFSNVGSCITRIETDHQAHKSKVPFGCCQNSGVKTSPDSVWKNPLMKFARQLQQGKGTGQEGYNGMVDCFRKIVKNEGFSRLYRGISAPILMEAPKR